eukprot:4582533-Pleurochrysis_carterae.AAC.1
MRERADCEEEWKLLGMNRARQGLKVTMVEKRTAAAGLAKQDTRKAKLTAKRAKRAAKATE